MQPSSVELRHGYQAGNFSILGSTLITGAVKWVNGGIRTGSFQHDCSMRRIFMSEIGGPYGECIQL